MRCFICGAPAAGSLVFETGNNAEYQVEPSLCESHLDEAERTGYDFEVKYAEQILEQLYERWRALGDGLVDQKKEGIS